MRGETEKEKLKRRLLKLLDEKNVIKTGTFILSSGKKSNYYVDIKKAITDPQVLDLIAELIKMNINSDNIDKIAGPALGAVPIATAVSLKTKKPLIIIRKEKKGYGTSKLIEGTIKEGDKVAIIEDVTTTGNSLLRAIRIIEENGGRVRRAFVIVDREEGAKKNLQREGFTLEPLFSISQMK
ncbi:MAG TPA: orotate phosphoribosyltransferase [Methanothermobacter sp.]|jgi:orotate phosphoribosyltransferase|uniref:Orotate phosphoribosyltransferase n=1 Tax=Methanothermobacter tenebrarum TaxID=680118 RepID=A0ABN6PCE6_9EURY|nr:orotate phosphoribosyltransferase [Methanothermobacter tenebrarum]MDD3454597.1 orotate phosphoribosyltransferase [Methanobacteriales archaeon]MDI6882549.1 orotate phosphoribosyltransferase [Methanothermobacter sp.]MDX9693320.1 orotate phosphoribosyltransferase [Methanothermobacter sp.]BDH79916.1 orotate phosphoribosyltransferase [Methanothermobacter tenebrarum]HHW16859.1 orotate phosphoribosyltransferase [Methanothermobacter sp.]